jgi:hypothetical protein
LVTWIGVPTWGASVRRVVRIGHRVVVRLQVEKMVALWVAAPVRVSR